MKALKFTNAQKAFVIKQGEEGSPVTEICRKLDTRNNRGFGDVTGRGAA